MQDFLQLLVYDDLKHLIKITSYTLMTIIPSVIINIYSVYSVTIYYILDTATCCGLKKNFNFPF